MARRKVTNVRERQRKRVPAIPEQASASRKSPEEEKEEDSVQSNKSGPALLALRMRRGLGARARGGSWFRYACGLRRGRGAR